MTPRAVHQQAAILSARLDKGNNNNNNKWVGGIIITVLVISKWNQSVISFVC